VRLRRLREQEGAGAITNAERTRLETLALRELLAADIAKWRGVIARVGIERQ